ncbi:MAG: DUF4062 domain-containing protein [Candidatus Hodarchaeota archaeon]
MTEWLIGIKVFLASPNGLRSERDHFKEIVWEFNETRASIAKVIFLPIMSEQMTGGTERAQGRIHKKMEECDYCITMFFDDLGSPPESDSPQGSASVTDGEYRKAKELIESGIMNEAVLFFKDVPIERMKDKGPTLTALLEYKEKRKKDSHFVEFADKEQFKKQVDNHLFKWMMDITGKIKESGPPVDVLDYHKPSSIAGGS